MIVYLKLREEPEIPIITDYYVETYVHWKCPNCQTSNRTDDSDVEDNEEIQCKKCHQRVRFY